MKKIVIYTVITGNYDDLKDPKVISENCDYVCFSNIEVKSSVWKHRNLQWICEDKTKVARYHKINSHKLFSNYEYSVWIDACVQIVGNVEMLIDIYRDNDFVAFKHPTTNCIYEEANVCKNLELDYDCVINEQMDSYKTNGYPENNGLIQSTCLFRKNTPEIIKLNNMWWAEVCKYSRRDQLSFNYCAYSLGIKYGYFSGGVWANNFFKVYSHKNSVSRKVKPRKYKIKAVIINHNQKESTNKLCEKLTGTFNFSVFDSGSDEDQVSQYTTHRFENLYWTGCWNKAMELFKDYDVLWVIGGDVDLKNSASEYRKAIEEAMPFGCWSPAIDGRSRDFMQSSVVGNSIHRVFNIEGICMAINTDIIDKCYPLLPEMKLGWGQDIWMSYCARQMNLNNIIDGRVVANHPVNFGYNQEHARLEMISGMRNKFGNNWRDVAHEHSDDFSYNIISKVDDLKETPTKNNRDGISIIVSSYNQIDSLKLALESYRNQTVLPLEVVIADDGSSDGTVEWIKSLSKDEYPFKIRCVTQEDRGYRHALINNLASEFAQGNRLLFTNADVIHNKTSVESHGKLLDNIIGAGIIKSIKGSSIGNITSDLIVNWNGFEEFYEKNKSGYTNVTFLNKNLNEHIAGIWGGSFSISKSKFEEIGGFDEKYIGWGGEEQDLVYRAIQKCVECKWVEKSVVYHLDHLRQEYTLKEEGRKRFRSKYNISGSGNIFPPIDPKKLIKKDPSNSIIDISGKLNIRRKSQ